MSYHPLAANTPGSYHPVYAAKSKWNVNITPAERLGRILIGLASVVWGIALLAGTPTLLTGTLEVLLIAFGLDMIVTGATGHCPLYQKLNYTPKSLQGVHHEPHTSGTDHAPTCH